MYVNAVSVEGYASEYVQFMDDFESMKHYHTVSANLNKCPQS